VTDTPNASTPTTPATAEQLREDVKFFRQRAQSIHGLMSANGDDDYQQDIDSYQRAAAALDAEAARMEAVTPTTDALDAAVARFNAWSFCRTLLMQGTAIQQDADVGKYPTYEHQSARVDEAARERAEVLDALVAAVEARAVARREAGEMQHPDTERFRVLTLHLLRHMTIADIDVFEEAVAEAGGEEPTDDHLVSAARVAVDALRLREDSPSSERLTEWGGRDAK
jgi:hypothetical protein